MKIIRLSEVRECENGRVCRKALVGDAGQLPTVVSEYADSEADLPVRSVGDEVVVAIRPYLNTKTGRTASSVEIVDF